MDRSGRAIRCVFRVGLAAAAIASTLAVSRAAHAQSTAEVFARSARTEGRFAAADSAYRQALDSYRNLGDAVGMTTVLGDLATLALESNPVGDPAPARGALNRALAIADSLREPALRSRILRALAWAHALAGDAGTADARGRDAVAAAVEAGDSTLVQQASWTMGKVSLERGRAPEAEAWFDRALARSDERSAERAEALIGLANARQIQGLLDPAEAGHREALALAEELGALELAEQAWVGLGGVEERRGNPSVAIERYTRAIALADSFTLTSPRSPAPATPPGYQAMIHLFARLAPSQPDSAYAAQGFRWAEQARMNALTQRLRRLGLPPRDTIVLLGLGDAQRLLFEKRSAILYYSTGDSSTSLWVVRRDQVRHARLVSRRILAPRVRALRASLADPSRAGDRGALQAGHQLYRALIQPVEPWLKGITELIVIPDAELAQLPFETLLQSPAGDFATPRDYLISRFAFRYSPALTVLGHLQYDDAIGPVIAVGDSAAIVVLSRLSRQRVTLSQVGSQATRSRLLATRELGVADIVFLASPAVANDVEPERSGIRLAPETGTSGSSFLSYADIVGLGLRGAQVTVPACEAGMTGVDGAAGVLGLGHAFLRAGAESVVLSHWRVRGLSTQRLLERYYAQRMKGGMSRSAALADTKRLLLQDAETRSPYFWAPFVLVGGSGIDD